MLKNINYKSLLEKIKSILIIATAFAVLGFYLGVRYQKGITADLENAKQETTQLKEQG